MRAMVLDQLGRIASKSVDIPATQHGEVLIGVNHSGICGTDLKIFTGKIPALYPLIMGHEISGTVVDATGASVPVGTRVLVDPMISCKRCFYCRAGQTNLCPNGRLIGRDSDGGFAEYVAVPSENLYSLPPQIEYWSTPLLQVFATCIHAQRLTKLFAGDCVAVFGLGVSGQLHAQLAKSRGACQVVGITRSKFKGELASRLGADLVFHENSVESVVEATDGRGADLVIETTGRIEALVDAIMMVRPGGKILSFGINTSTSAQVPFYQLYFKEVLLIHARAACPQDYEAAIHLVETGMIQIKPLITHRLSVWDLEAAMELVQHDAEDRLKIILEH